MNKKYCLKRCNMTNSGDKNCQNKDEITGAAVCKISLMNFAPE